jgi:CubicO group peptidase (beta-lactamase class C family)
MKKILLLLTFITLYSTSFSLDTAKLDSLFVILEENDKAMGSLSIYKDGEEVYSNSLGYENIENGAKATAKSEYRIGSISKTFTATIIMKLIESKKLTLETKLGKYYPKIENSDKITIKHLLKHRSGIFNFTNDEEYTEWMEEPISKEDLVDVIAEHPSSFKPDTKAEYSNSNYVLLSFIAEDVLKKDFATILEEMITKPCKLDDTYYGGTIGSKSNEAQSYTYTGEWLQATETDMSVPMGAGAIVSTASDLNKFLYCLFNGKVVSDATLKEMMNLEDRFGAGLFTVPYRLKTAYGHTGGIDGFQSNAFYFPDEKMSLTYLSNGVAIPLNNILLGVLSIYFGDEYELPVFAPAIEVPTAQLEQYVGVYSSTAIPMKMNIFIEDNVLYGQGTGQAKFPLEAFEKHKFKFEPAMLTIEFRPESTELVIVQGGGELVMKKE